MAEAGRVKHHIKNLITNERNLLLFVGFATPDSLAGKLKAGANPVRIFGEFYQVNASIVSLDYFSAHADQKEMISYLRCQDPSFVKKIFLVHGRNTARESFRELLVKEGYKQVELPEFGYTYYLD
jgi:metallo-beta-lactamase family protein